MCLVRVQPGLVHPALPQACLPWPRLPEQGSRQSGEGLDPVLTEGLLSKRGCAAGRGWTQSSLRVSQQEGPCCRQRLDLLEATVVATNPGTTKPQPTGQVKGDPCTQRPGHSPLLCPAWESSCQDLCFHGSLGDQLSSVITPIPRGFLVVSRPPGIHWRLSPSQEAPGACSQGSGDGAPTPQSPKFSWIIGTGWGRV